MLDLAIADKVLLPITVITCRLKLFNQITGKLDQCLKQAKLISVEYKKGQAKYTFAHWLIIITRGVNFYKQTRFEPPIT